MICQGISGWLFVLLEAACTSIWILSLGTLISALSTFSFSRASFDSTFWVLRLSLSWVPLVVWSKWSLFVEALTYQDPLTLLLNLTKDFNFNNKISVSNFEIFNVQIFINCITDLLTFTSLHTQVKLLQALHLRFGSFFYDHLYHQDFQTF